MLYEMLSLKPAFDAQNLVSLFYKIVKADYEVSYHFEGTKLLFMLHLKLLGITRLKNIQVKKNISVICLLYFVGLVNSGH